MLLSFILRLTPLAPTTLEGFYGRQAQGWLLDRVRVVAPNLASQLHARPESRPYTVSSLIVPSAGRREEEGRVTIGPRDLCLLRFTSLASPLTEVLCEHVLPNLPRKLHLKWSEFKILGLSDESEWRGQTTFADLARAAGQNHRGPSVTLHFASPTAFRRAQIDQSLPTPDLVWGSLYRRWNAFAPEDLQIDPLWPDFAAQCIIVSDFTLRSMKVSFKGGEKGAATGATGRATYRLLEPKHCGEFAPFRPGAENVLRTLAGFALYAGVGHHTSSGLGQARARD